MDGGEEAGCKKKKEKKEMDEFKRGRECKQREKEGRKGGEG